MALDPRRLRRAQELFDQAVQENPQVREDWLQAQCGHDPELLSAVRSLLAADLEAEDFLDHPILTPAGPLPEIAEPARPPIGPYSVLGKIGQGGTSFVYLGRRTDRPWDRKVALKVLRDSLLDSEQANRIMREAGVLAQLNHPYIATLIDASRTSDGRAYLVTEYVQGQPIHDYCDAQRLSIRDRVKLFIKVCEAVTYAHQNLVIHRDIKPGNLLVQSDGVPKLLDFGLAKLLEPVGSTASTTAVRMLTPNYASPEHLAGERITTASDTYSLGVVLHELLTSEKPRDWSGFSVYQMLAAFREHDPLPPSRRVLEGDFDREHAAWLRGASTRSLARQLRGDLDRILDKALQVDPDLRYPSPADLARDLRRHLLGLPVTAGSPPPLYRLRKFCRRHTLLLAHGTILALLLTGSTIMALRQASRLEEERNQASLSEARAEEVKDFLVEIFGSSDPFRGNTVDLTAREVLDTGAARIGEEMADQPELRAELRSVIGVVYSRLREFDRAQEFLELALRPDDQGLVDPLDRGRATLELAEVRLEQGDLDAAERDLETALDLLQPLGVPSAGSFIADTHRLLAEVRSYQGRHDEAAAYARQAIELHTEHAGPLSENVPYDLNVLVAVLYRAGDLEGAEEAGRQSYEIFRKQPNADEASLSNLLGNLASVLAAGGKYDEAEALHRENLELRRSIYGDDHPLIANTLNNLASMLLNDGRELEAERLVTRAYEINRLVHSEDHPNVVANLNHRARALYMMGRLDEADQVAGHALNLVRGEALRDHAWTVVSTLNTRARILLDLGLFEEAEQLATEDLELRRGQWEDSTSTVAKGLLTLARIQQARGQSREAEATYREFLAVADDVWKPYQWYPAWGRVHYASLLTESGRAAEALTLIEPAEIRLATLLPEGHFMRAVATSVLGATRYSLEPSTSADRLLDRSHRELQQLRGDRSWLTQQAAQRVTALSVDPAITHPAG